MNTTTESEHGSANRKDYRRRQYVINPRFQWKWAGWLMADLFILCLFMGIVFANLMEQHVRARLLGLEETTPAGSAAVVFGFAAVLALLAGATFGIWSVIITHRFCGPIFVIGRCLDELVAGRFPTMRALRKKDEFKEFYAQFGRTLDTLKSRKQAEFEALSGILELAQGAANEDDDARKQALKQIATRVGSLRGEAAKMLGEESNDEPRSSSSPGESRSKPAKSFAHTTV